MMLQQDEDFVPSSMNQTDSDMNMRSDRHVFGVIGWHHSSAASAGFGLGCECSSQLILSGSRREKQQHKFSCL